MLSSQAGDVGGDDKSEGTLAGRATAQHVVQVPKSWKR